MVQGTLLLVISCVFLIPTRKLRMEEVLLIWLIILGTMTIIVLDLTKRQGSIYGQSVLRLAGTVLKTQMLAKEREDDISKLESAYLISEDEINLHTRLASGGFGEVWRGSFVRLPGLPVAIKKIFLTPENMEIEK